MTCTISSDQKVFICTTPTFYTFVGKCKRRINFMYSPWYGLELLNDKHKVIEASKAERAAMCDWVHRNTYRRPPNGQRELLGYVKRQVHP